MTMPAAPTAGSDVGSARALEVAVSALLESAAADGQADARQHGPEGTRGHEQTWAAGTPAREQAARAPLLAAQRGEAATASHDVLVSQSRVDQLSAWSSGKPTPDGVGVQPSGALLVGYGGAAAVLAAEVYVLKNPFDTLLGAGTGFAWAALGISLVMTGAAALGSHFRARAVHERGTLPPGPSHARDSLQTRVVGLTALLVVESLMAFCARAYDASYGQASYLNAATLAFGLVQLVFFVLAMNLPGVLLRLHEECKATAVATSLNEAKAHLAASTITSETIRKTHEEQLDRLLAARRDTTIAYLSALAAATRMPEVHARILELMGHVADDGTIPGVTPPTAQYPRRDEAERRGGGAPPRTPTPEPTLTPAPAPAPTPTRTPTPTPASASAPTPEPASAPGGGPTQTPAAVTTGTRYSTPAEMFADILNPR